MNAWTYSLFTFYVIFFHLLTSSIATQRLKTDSTIVKDEIKTESYFEDEWQSNDDEYVDTSKFNKASYQHEQSLLANIYAPNRTYVSAHDDRIYPTNFSYFTFNSLGTYRFILISLRGDADLYISTRHKYVTYDNYDQSSCTCGIDEIFIDHNMKRPIYIGIYGYSRYQISHYRLLVELIDTKPPTEEVFQESSDDHRSSSYARDQQGENKGTKGSTSTVTKDDDGQHILWNIFLWLLNFLVEVLA